MQKINRNNICINITDWRNVITYCYIHNDSTVEISKCGKRIASFRELINHQLIIGKYIKHI